MAPLATVQSEAPAPAASARLRLHPLDSVLGAALALLLAGSLLGLPWAAARIPDGVDRLELMGWTLVLAALLAVPAARLSVSGWLGQGLARRATLFQPFLVLAMVLAVAAVQVGPFHSMPQFPDSFAELWQARMLASGRLWLPSPERAELVRIANVVDAGGRWYAQYPVGNPALLALGLLTGVPWLPAALSALLFGTGLRALARESTGEGAAALALLLALASPMIMLSLAAGMSQATFSALATWALALALRSRRHAISDAAPDVAAARGPRPARRPSGLAAALGCGLLTGLAATVRPLDALVLGIVALAGLLAASRGRAARAALWVAAAAAGTAPVLVVNALTTGAPFRFGYSVLWGSGTLPGFGPRGRGLYFGPADGLRSTVADLGGLQMALTEWALPVLALAGLGLVLRRRWSAPQRLLLAYAAAQVAAYFTYFHHDFFYGPRFLLPLAAPLLVLIADGITALGAAAKPARRLAAGALAYCRELVTLQLAAAAVLVAWPRLASAGSRDIAVAAAIRDASFAFGRPRAALLVDDGWGSRLMAQMWRLGVSAPAAERFYAAADACRLERAIRHTALTGRSGTAAVAALEEELDGATPGVPLRRPPAPRLRLPLGALPPECAEELAYDEERLRSAFSPLLFLNDPDERGVVFWRDPGPARLAWLLREAGRPLYRVRLMPAGAGTMRVALEPLLSPGPLRLR